MLVTSRPGAASRRVARQGSRRQGGHRRLEGIPWRHQQRECRSFRRSGKKYPGIKIWIHSLNIGTPKKGSKLDNICQKYKKIDVVWAQDDDVLSGSFRHLRNRGAKMSRFSSAVPK
jgi:ABC-type sugar transport system substrate-binding protein